MTIYLDTETFSEVGLKSAGTYRYAENAEVMLLGYAIDNAEPAVWDLNEQMPYDLHDALCNVDEPIVAHHAMFDRNVMRLGKMKLDLPRSRWRCSMVRALAHGLPGGLDILCEIFALPQDQRKLKTGRQLIQLFCKPRPKNMTLRRATRETHPAEWAQFKDYLRGDIVSMREVWKKLPRWNYDPDGGPELALWHLDQRINDRGVAIDLDLAESAIRAVDRAQSVLRERTQDRTDNAVQSATQRDALLSYILGEHGVDLPDLQAATLERRMDDPELPDAVRELLRIRLETSTTSTSKYRRLLSATSDDGRLRGTIQFDGANRTRRAAGRTFQPQNLPRVFIDAIADFFGFEEAKDVKPKHIQLYLDLGVDALKADCEDLSFPSVMKLASNLIRGAIVAPPGRKLVIADLSNIEGRVAAWIANEEWKIQAFRDFDTVIGVDEDGKPVRKGADLYKLAYAKSFNIAVEMVTTKDERQIGKVQELMFQYGGGVGAWITGADTYGIDLEAMTAAVAPSLPTDVVEEATDFLAWLYQNAYVAVLRKRKLLGKEFTKAEYKAARDKWRIENPEADEKLRLDCRQGLSEPVFVACDSLKRLWRRANPNISAIWKKLEDAARAVIDRPGLKIQVNSLTFVRSGNWLRIILPSGRCLCYPSPRVEDGTISYMGIDQYSRKWKRIHTYGGKLYENVVQGISRDILYDGMPAVETEGYEIVLSVHDELITETPDIEDYSHEALAEIMATNPPWAAGLPLAAAGFETYRYRKE